MIFMCEEPKEELKTLKDLQFTKGVNKELRQEAINHIHKFKEEIQLARNGSVMDFNFSELDINEHERKNNLKDFIYLRQCQIRYIMWNNNLTEENLK